MAKFNMTVFQKKKHEKAFEFYAEVDSLGKHRSNATIAGMVGSSPAAVAYWKKRDNWDGKLISALDAAIDEADMTNKAIKKLLRESLYGHIRSLNRVIEFSKSDDDKVSAIKAFVHIAKELGCLDPDTGGTDPNTTTQFRDDLGEKTASGNASVSDPSKGTPSAVLAQESSEDSGGAQPTPPGEPSTDDAGSRAEAGTSGSDPVYPLHSGHNPPDVLPDSWYTAPG